MAFIVHSTDDGRIPGIEYHPASTITPQVGMALSFQTGKLAVVSEGAPTYISMTSRDAALSDGDVIPVIRVSPDMIFSTVSNASMASVNPGDLVTLHTDGLSVTATTASGVAEIVKIIDPAQGGEVLVRFPAVSAPAE